MSAPAPWSGGLPWNDPAFSRRMLVEHLSQAHGAASRRFETIDAHTAWLHHEILATRPSRVLDLGCGPGLYTSRLAALGHQCTGIDFAPAAIEYAGREASTTGAACTYRLEDLRTAELGRGFDLIMFLFGDLDTLPPVDAAGLLMRTAAALAPGGRLVLEVHTLEAVRKMGKAGRSRADLDGGLFADGPHTVTEESWWQQRDSTAIRRIRVHRPGRRVEEHVITTQARGEGTYPLLLQAAGLLPEPPLTAFGEAIDPGFVVLTAVRP